MSESTVTARGQVTVPADIRKALGIEARDKVVFTLLADGTVLIRAKNHSAAELKGKLKPPRGVSKLSIDKMNIGRK